MKNLIKSIVLFLILNLIGASALQGQSTELPTRLVEEKNAISFNLGGSTGGLGIAYERHIQNRVTLEAGLGYWLVGGGYGAGVLVYPYAKTTLDKANIYFGIRHSHQAFTTLLTDHYSIRTYIPIGYSFYTDSHFTISMDIGPSFHKEIGYSFTFIDSGRVITRNKTRNSVFGNLKVAFRF